MEEKKGENKSKIRQTQRGKYMSKHSPITALLPSPLFLILMHGFLILYARLCHLLCAFSVIDHCVIV